MKSFRNGIYFALGLFLMGGLALGTSAAVSSIFSVKDIDTKGANSTVSHTDFNSIVSTLKGIYNDAGDDADDPMDNKVGIGTEAPSSKLDIAGEVTTTGVNLRNAFLQKQQAGTQFGNDYSSSCETLVSDLPQAVQDNGRCSCDISDTEPECELDKLIETDQPGCYDLYQIDMDSSAKYYPSPKCHDLKADLIQYFELWNLKQRENQIVAPFYTYGSCPTVTPTPGTELGSFINEKLKKTSCLSIKLRDSQTYSWEKNVSIAPNVTVSISTLNALNGAQGAQAIITMSQENTYTYYGTTYRAPSRAIVSGTLYISSVQIRESIASSLPETPTSSLQALFNIGTKGLLALSQGEISATEDIVNFYGFSQNGIFKTGHQWYYRDPASPRSSLYVVRADSGWSFSGHNGTVGWSTPHVHLNKKIDGTTGTGVQQYPSATEKKRLNFLD